MDGTESATEEPSQVFQWKNIREVLFQRVSSFPKYSG